MTNCHKTDNVESALNYPPKFTHLHFPLFYVLLKFHFLKVEAIASELKLLKGFFLLQKGFLCQFRKIMGCVGMWIPVEKWKMIQRCAISDFMSGLPLHHTPQRKRPVCECFEQECELSVKKTLILWSWVKLHLILLSSSS